VGFLTALRGIRIRTECELLLEHLALHHGVNRGKHDSYIASIGVTIVLGLLPESKVLGYCLWCVAAMVTDVTCGGGARGELARITERRDHRAGRLIPAAAIERHAQSKSPTRSPSQGFCRPGNVHVRCLTILAWTQLTKDGSPADLLWQRRFRALWSASLGSRDTHQASLAEVLFDPRIMVSHGGGRLAHDTGGCAIGERQPAP